MTDEIQNGAMPADENKEVASDENQTTEGEAMPTEENKEEATSTEEAM